MQQCKNEKRVFTKHIIRDLTAESNSTQRNYSEWLIAYVCMNSQDVLN